MLYLDVTKLNNEMCRMGCVMVKFAYCLVTATFKFPPQKKIIFSKNSKLRLQLHCCKPAVDSRHTGGSRHIGGLLYFLSSLGMQIRLIKPEHMLVNAAQRFKNLQISCTKFISCMHIVFFRQLYL